jgi:hypothetical protein
MKIDAYTKFLLTVITLCLLYLCANNLFRVPKVQADAPVRVLLVDADNIPVVGVNGITRIRVDVGR